MKEMSVVESSDSRAGAEIDINRYERCQAIQASYPISFGLTAMIDSYDFGEIVIDGRKFESDLIIFPDRIDSSWWRKDGHTLGVDDVQDIVKAKPEVLIVGTGYSGIMKVHPATEQYLTSSGIELLAAKTKSACKTYNVLLKSRRVIAALHLTC